MRFEHRLTYDATPSEVYSMLSDPIFRERVCEAQKARDWDVSIDSDGDGMTVSVDQKRPSDGIPGFARKVVGDEIHIAQRETWKDPSGATLEVTIPHKPGHLKGTIDLRQNGAGTVQAISGELSVRVPLVAGKLENLISAMLGAALETERRIGTIWLGSGR